MLEKDIENLIAAHPDDIFPGEGFRLIGQQVEASGRRLDILFEDKHRRRAIVEVKRGILSREASGQIAEYYGLLKNDDPDGNYELILCANVIPKERRTFLETIGISCTEVGITQITELANKYGYRFIDDQSAFTPSATSAATESASVASALPSEVDNSEISVWIFQANPNLYDILNSLGDPEIGNTIHWLVKQHSGMIHKGHMAFIWMSGRDAGIYALTRVESEPDLMTESDAERKFWLNNQDPSPKKRVRLTVLRRFVNKPILKTELLKIPALSRLSILRQFQGTNFPVKNSEWAVLSKQFT